MKYSAMILIALAMPTTLTGCGKTDTPTVVASVMDNLCSEIKNTGLTKQCSVGTLNSLVSIVIDTNDEETARNLCAKITGRVKPQVTSLNGKWRLQIYSLYRDDKPLATCPLN